MIFIPGKGISQFLGIFQFVSESNLTPTQIEKIELISKKPYAISVQAFRSPEIRQKFNENILIINLNDQVTYSAIRTDTKSWGKDELSWIGKPEREGKTGEYVILEHTSQGLTGIIWFNDILYSIAPLDNEFSFLYQIDQSQLPPDHPKDWLMDTGNGSFESQNSYTDTSSLSSYKQNIKSTITYDLLVAYTPAAQNAAADIDALINTAVNQTNQIYGNSQTTLRAHLVYKMLVNYTEVDMTTDLNRLINPSDDYMDNVHTYRDQYGADIVVLILGSGGYGGLAGAIKAEEDEAFAVVKWDCATQQYSFTHEIGHLFGSEHEVGYDDNDYLPYPYNHGFRHSDPTFLTIMAIKGEGSIARIPYLSTPNTLGYYNGNYYTIGSEEWENNARVHTERANTVASFRTPSPPPLSVTITGPTYLNSGEVGTFTANPSGGSGTYTNYQWWYRNDEGSVPPKAVKGGVSPMAPPPGYWIYLSYYEGEKTINFGPSFDFSLKCKVTDSDGNTATDIHSVIVGGPAKDIAKKIPINVIESIPEQLTLIGNYPNPFNPTTSIKFGLPDAMPVEISIYSITGKKVSTLINQELSAGYYQVNWDGTNKSGNKVASGIYIYTLKTGSKRLTSKMLFAK